MRRFLALALLLSLAWAQCDLAQMQYIAIETTFEIVGGGAAFLTLATMPLPTDCLAENNLSALLQGPAACPADIYDDIYKGAGMVITNTECVVSYAGGQLRIAGRGEIPVFAEEAGGRMRVSFPKWNVRQVNGTATALEIILPADAESFEWAPREGSRLDNLTIRWEPVPAEAPSVVYSLKQESNTGTIILALLCLVGAVALFFVVRFAGNWLKREQGLKDDEALAVENIRQLEHDYLKRKIDEATFKRAVQDCNQRLAGIRARKKLGK